MSGSYLWSESLARRAAAILNGCESFAEGAKRIAADKAFAHVRVTRSALDGAFRRFGMGTAFGQTRGGRARLLGDAIDVDIDTSDFEAPKPPDTSRELPHDTEPAPPPRPEKDVSELRRQHRQQEEQDELRRQNRKMLEELADLHAQLDTLRAFGSTPVAPIVDRTPRRQGSKRHGTPVMICSDWHVEERVLPATVNGLNQFDLDIADRCIDRMTDAFLWLLHDSRYDCRDAVVALLGDLFSGHIHEELMEENALSPVEAIVWLHARIVRMLTRILNETNLERIVVPCCDGNHGRLTHKTRISTRTKNSLEWLLYKQLAAHFANEPRIQFQIADGAFNYLRVQGAEICFTHGDTFKFGGGVGGLLIPARKGANELRKYRHFDHLVMGHFHQRLDEGTIIVNGSMIGINAYSMSLKCTPEPRQQTWFMVDSERGKCTSNPIWLPSK